ncbi:MAG: hypothetical protein WCJ30_04800 [Deltaproteobacteria bacterium]
MQSSPRSSRRTVNVLALVLSSAATVTAQSPPRGDRGDAASATAQAPRCSARVRTIAPQRARPDTREAPALVLVDDGALLAWRAAEGTLFLSRLDARYERRADDRELAHPTGPFAMIPALHGAVLAYAERSAAGDSVVMLARVTATGEARNVPRELGRGRAIEHVTIAPTPAGYAIAWSTPMTASGSRTHLVLTDGRGVPLGVERAVASGSAPRLVYLPATQTVVLAATAGTGEPIIAIVEAEGTLGTLSGWSSTGRAVAVAGGGNAAIALTSVADANGAGTPGIVRFSPEDGVSSSPISLHLASTASPVALLGDRTGMLVLVDEGIRRESLFRVASDGTATLLAIRAGHAGTVVPTTDGYVVAGHQPVETPLGGVDLVTLACPRPPPPPASPPAPPPTTGAALANASLSSSASGGSPQPDAGAAAHGVADQ